VTCAFAVVRDEEAAGSNPATPTKDLKVTAPVASDSTIGVQVRTITTGLLCDVRAANCEMITQLNAAARSW
jgi:hypothetical protein